MGQTRYSFTKAPAQSDPGPPARCQCQGHAHSAADDTFVSAKSDNHNATCMSSFLQERRLATTPLHLQDGSRPVTWVSPVGKATQLDYVVLPDELAACSATTGVPEGFIDHNGIDHKILAVSMEWQTGHTASRKPLRFDVKAMQTSWGRATLQRIHARDTPGECNFGPEAFDAKYSYMGAFRPGKRSAASSRARDSGRPLLNEPEGWPLQSVE